MSAIFRQCPRNVTRYSVTVLKRRRKELHHWPTLLNRIAAFSTTSAPAQAQYVHNNTIKESEDDTSTSVKYFDVLIVGGGVVGCSLARLLSATIPSIHVGLLEAREIPSNSSPTTTDDSRKDTSSSSSPPHPRSYALSPNSMNILGETTVSQLEQQGQLGYYTSMQVWQANSPASLTFTTRDLNADPSKAPYLGAVVEDSPLVKSLWQQLQRTSNHSNDHDSAASNVACYANTTLTSMDMGDDGVDDEYDDLVKVTTNQGEIMEAALLVGADGGNSWVRNMCGISRTGTDDNQHALTFTVELRTRNSNHGRAFQRFLPDGSILALLPTHSENHGVIVWSTSPSTVREWKDNDVDNESSALVHCLNDLLMQGPQRVPPLLELQDQQSSSSPSDMAANLLYGAERVLDTVHYGMAMASHHPDPKFMAPPQIARIVSNKFSFPLSCYQAQSYTKGQRIALVGDAAHTIHPMAGQGLNLGLADVQALVNCIQKAANAGMDVSTFLDEYGTNRHRSVSISLAGVHALQRLFGNQQDTVLQHAKTFGLNFLQNAAPLRRQLVQAAAFGV